MVVTYHKDFIKDSKKLTVSQKEKLTQRLRLFSKNEFDPLLNSHNLKGKYLGYKSISITGDLRAIYKQKSKNNVIFIRIDNHSNLYG